MTAVAPQTPQVVRATPGRVRIHLPGWSTTPTSALEQQVRELAGVHAARADRRTANVLVSYDPATVDADRLLARLAEIGGDAPESRPQDRADAPPASPPAAPLRTQRRGYRLRIAVRGLQRDADLGRRVVEQLERLPDVARAAASPVTGRVLVDLASADADVDELLELIGELELPDAPGEDVPSHPLDPAPLIQSSARLIGAVLGLGVLATRRALGKPPAPLPAGPPAALAAAAGILEGLPPLARRVEAALGRDRTQLLFGAVSIVSLTSSGGALGLAVTGLSALGLLTEVRARRKAWHEYEERLGPNVRVHAGVVLQLEPGDRVPLPADVLAGFGRALGPDGLTLPVAPGRTIPGGARIEGPGVEVRLRTTPGLRAARRERPPARTPYDRYVDALVPLSLGYAGLLGFVRRSLHAAFAGLLLVTPRAALVGVENADNLARARAIRCGATVVGTRGGSRLRRPDALLAGCPRVLTDGVEVASVTVVEDAAEPRELLDIAAAIATAAGSPWGPAFRARGEWEAVDATFDGSVVAAEVRGERWVLRAATAADAVAADAWRRGEEPLILARATASTPAAVIALRPRLAPGLAELQDVCTRRRVDVAVIAKEPTAAARAVARRAGVALLEGRGLAARVREHQHDGRTVAVVVDAPEPDESLTVADLAIAVTSGRRGAFLGHADLLTPTLDAVAGVLDTAARRDAAERDAIGLSLAGNVAGAAWGLRGIPAVRNAANATLIAALGALVTGWLRLAGGRRARSVAERLADPQPERWGRVSAEEALRVLGSSADGLTAAEVRRRRGVPRATAPRRGFASAIVEQVRSPLIAALALGAGLSLALGAIADVGMIGSVIVANAAIGAWQEREAGRATEALDQMTGASATIVRDGEELVVPATDVVRGDVLVLAPGQRVAADARLLSAESLEVDEASLTGESLPAPKSTNGGDTGRVVLDGSDIVAGTGRAVAVATGADSRLGALAAALALPAEASTPLDDRLRSILREALPLIGIASGAIVASGLAWGGELVPQLALAASAAIAAVPEGLPLLAGIASAAVARRLAARHALVRRLSAVESLGRVDVACADKTGTLTQGRLAVRVVATADGREGSPEHLDDALSDVLLAAALASPHPDAAHARSHPTDVAVLEAARRAGLGPHLGEVRVAELPFEPSRGFHAAVVDTRVVVKGAPEVIAPRCVAVRRGGRDEPLGDRERAALVARSEELATEGLRVLMIAEGPAEGEARDPANLVALGFLGIADPLRPTVRDAVRRCEEAGVRVVMLTGDHPATAQSVAREAGLVSHSSALLTGPELHDLDPDELAARLEAVRVVARITPLDKVRIVEALRRRGHVVAMTGDGVNDAPALRLADVGVAMGRSGTEVAREAADIVLADDDFSTLAEALVEGRGFWLNLRRSLAMLLGGNLGELGLIAGAGVAGLATPLTTRQILAVNLITDVLPAVAIAVQEPEHRRLGDLAREGATSLDVPLRNDILRRGAATAVPSVAAYLAAQRLMSPVRARSVAFASIVATQLGHTLDLGRVEGRLSRAVLAAVVASAGITAGAILLPGVSGFLGLAAPPAAGLALVLGATAGAVAMARALEAVGGERPAAA